MKPNQTYQKQKYEKPAMQVYELSRQPQLLAGSEAERSPYVPAEW